MRAFAFISIVLSLVALILSMLCLFAGHTRGFIEDGQILTITISPMGKERLWNLTTSNPDNTDSQLGSLTSQVGINDWYSLYVMNYCTGSYANSTSEATESCSEAVPFFSFNPIQLIRPQLNGSSGFSIGGLSAGVSISASGWPSQIDDVSGKIESGYKAMFFMLCLGIAASGVEAIVSLVVVLMDRRDLNHGLALASTIITATMVPFVNTVNVQGADIGLGATKGTKFLWMTWSATVLMLLTGCIWLLDYFVERRFLYCYGTQAYGNTRMMDYRAREKELKAERKMYKKERAMEHEAYKSARLAQRAHGTRGFLQPLPGELVRHAAICIEFWASVASFRWVVEFVDFACEQFGTIAKLP
ncbi:SUR7/PalI family-domain-containing protein [Pestalotiopsis sp. NC0098]|nr:SUR7/PalI family-domain-containing protein [Pestalotiopsis sp. NC0098]